MKKNVLTLIVVIASAIATYAQSTEAQSALNNVDKQYFIENKGQWPDEVLYVTRIGGLDAWITKSGVLYDFYILEEEQHSTTTEGVLPDKYEHKNYTKYGQRVWYKFQGNNIHVTTESKEKQEGYFNYLIGNDPSKHASNVGLYKEVTVKNVYKGIDVRYYFDKGSIRYDYVVYPGADPSQIAFSLKGTDKTYLNQKGNFVFNTGFGEVALAELHTYQETKDNTVSSSFEKTENGWCIAIGDYDMNQTLIIDPLIYSTFLGGSNDEYGNSIAIDASGNAIVTGNTESTNYDTTAGAYQISNGGSQDVFVTKLNATGSALVYSTYMGGSNNDVGMDIAIDASDNVYVTGGTNSSNYPTTSGAYQQSIDSVNEVFVTKLKSTGTALVYSTYLGGNGTDYGVSIAIDASGYVYVTGYTYSSNYPTTSGAYQTSYAGSGDVFVTKLNTTGSALVYSTYLGGSSHDIVYSIATDASGYVYVTGYTQSNDYGITSGAYQTSHAGGIYDVFVTKLNATGTALVYSTYLGGSGYDAGTSIAIDASGYVNITGLTESTNYPTTSVAYQASFAGGDIDIFITKLNATGSGLVYSTYLGGSGDDYGHSIAIDASGYIYVTGYTTSTDYDITSGAYQTTYGGGSHDLFVTKLNTTATALVYSTFLGGGDWDVGNSITIDASGNAYVTGETSSTDFDTTAGVYQTNNAGGTYDVFVTKIYLGAYVGIADQANAQALQLFPNPANTEVSIKGEFTAPIQIEIIDASGRVNQAVYSYDNHAIKLNVSSLTNGMYWIRMVNKEQVFQSKIIVQH